MSFILDALKKAEAEQDPDLRASLAISSQVNRRHRIIQYLIIAALLGNLLVLLWLFGPTEWTDRLPAANPEAAPALVTEPEVTKANVEVEQPPTPSTDSPGIETAATVARSSPPLRRTTLGELDSRTRARLPALEFSTHVYASDTAMRAVVVNGQRLAEGDQFDNLILEEITESGVVVRFENYLVTISVLDEWE